MNIGRIGSVGAMLLVSAALAACGGGESGEQAAGGDANAALGGDGKLTIAMIAKSSTNPVFLSARVGAEAAAKELSQARGVPIEIVWLTPPQEDGQVQAQRVAQAVNEGADAILLSASDAGKVTGAIRDAVARGVQVMTFDSDVPESGRFAFYGVDDAETGAKVMTELAAQLGAQGGEIGILAGNQNAPNLQKRVQGVKDQAAKHPGVKIAGVFNHPETPQDAAAEVIRATNAYPNIRGWAMIGGWPLFTTALLDELDPARVKIVAVDALPAELPYVERGLAPVLLAQPTYQWGYVGVETIVKKLLDNEQVPERIPMELVRVSKENLGDWARQLKEWGFTDVDQKYLDLPPAPTASR
ncbi:MAG: substrate-binding domain-containing protein [Gemmatimonadetes bacterium]|nr:substrate-binding domain-containing protein [Gemmatimonadota bacterium]